MENILTDKFFINLLIADKSRQNFFKRVLKSLILEMPKIKGVSDKQIKYAEEMRSKKINDAYFLNRLLTRSIHVAADDVEEVMFLDYILKKDSAKFWIECNTLEFKLEEFYELTDNEELYKEFAEKFEIED